jgi:hypothetical protein
MKSAGVRGREEERLEAFLARYTPEIAALARAAIAKMRARLPGAVELVYDNYNALVIGFGPSERASEGIFSVAVYPRWVNLFFLRGSGLPDPAGLLKGMGKSVRHIRVSDAGTLDTPAVQALVTAALERAVKPIDASQPRRLVIRPVSPRQRPRRTTAP